MRVLLVGLSFGMLPRLALGAGINVVVWHVPGVCIQPLGEVRCFHSEQFLLEQLFAQHP